MNTFSILKTNTALKVFLSVILMIACANISIPLKPVPITLQTMGVLLIGLSLKPREALLAILGYVSLGAAGAPVFTGWASGVNCLVGATGGYCVGFICAAPAMAFLRQKFSSPSSLFILSICFVGQFIIYTFGISWLANSYGWEKAISVGLIPFILPGMIKCVLLTGILKTIHILRK
jgi:biotin transport system substrate-specific component